MPRPKRKQLKFDDEDSINNLLQEIYNESQNIRAQVITLFNKWNANIKENGEIAAVGDKIAKLLTILSKNQDQKIMLLKHMKDSVYLDGKNNDNTAKPNTLTKESKDELDNFVEQIKKQQKESNN